MIIISIVMITLGFYLLEKNTPPGQRFDFNSLGGLLVIYGIIIFMVGKIVAWFQKL